MSILFAALLAALPPVKSVQDAQSQLALPSEAQQVEAWKNLAAACRSTLRLSLRDQPGIVAKARTTATSGSAPLQRAMMDAGRCFSPGVFTELLKAVIARGEIVAYAAEAATRIADPLVAPPLLDAFDKRKATCKTKDLAATEVEICVWLIYAPGAVLSGADRALKQRAADAASSVIDAPYPKLREVAAETLSASKK